MGLYVADAVLAGVPPDPASTRQSAASFVAPHPLLATNQVISHLLILVCYDIAIMNRISNQIRLKMSSIVWEAFFRVSFCFEASESLLGLLPPDTEVDETPALKIWRRLGVQVKAVSHGKDLLQTRSKSQ